MPKRMTFGYFRRKIQGLMFDFVISFIGNVPQLIQSIEASQVWAPPKKYFSERIGQVQESCQNLNPIQLGQRRRD